MSQSTERIHELVDELNRYRDEYYNKDAPSVSDAVYDHLYDELERLENKSGIILSNSPTQTVGYKAVSSLEKVRHPIPLLSLGKTKMVSELAAFLKKHAALLMLKLDGLIDVERLKETLTGSDGKPYHNARNLAAGSIRCLDANICKNREISFFAFNILAGMDGFTDIRDSRSGLLLSLSGYGFGVCPFLTVSPGETAEDLAVKIKTLTDLAEIKACPAGLDIPIDGMLLRFDSFSYSASLDRTGHHYNDGIAFKFEDDTYETVFRSIEWQAGRSGEIAPVAVFDTVEIDGCEVSRASLHNLTFIKGLELHPGCRILVSKRNMVIPHVNELKFMGKSGPWELSGHDAADPPLLLAAHAHPFHGRRQGTHGGDAPL